MSKLNIPSKKNRQIKAQRLRTEFPFYARYCLKVKDKKGKIVSFILNEAQTFLHEKLENQIKDFGRVRALILKGRQQGCSTYVEGRFYHKTSLGQGKRAFILSHEADASANLFSMAKRFHERCPEIMTPDTERSNRQELVFAGKDCSYRVATAGTKAVGRSETVQLFHGSEVAFWPKADEHSSGALQTVPDENGTEIILESTANGMGNLFHKMWIMAEKGLSDYLAIFIPWYWQKEYRREVAPGFQLTRDEQEYQEAHGVSLEAMAWRRAKITEIREDRFRQEYPATAAEAFQTSGKGLLIFPELILAARKGVKQISGRGPIIGGCDPAGDGDDGDRTAFVIRQGRIVHHYETILGLDTMEVAGRCVRIINEWRLSKMFIDKVGIGAGVCDRVKELTPAGVAIGVNAGNKTSKPDRYFNLRAEMYGEMANWFEDQPVVLPDDDEFQADLMCIKKKYNSNSVLKLEPKEKIREEFGRSPDLADGLALTFSYPVAPDDLPVKPGASNPRRKYNPHAVRAS